LEMSLWKKLIKEKLVNGKHNNIGRY
jgi:hypothetical protein